MPNSHLPVGLSRFDCVGDNLVQPVATTWGRFAQSLIAGHTITEEHKLSLPCFSAWRYKDITDPTIDHGTDDYGRPLKQFSITHTRRIQGNLVEMFGLVLDFDGKLPVSEVQSKFGEFEYVCYTSLNHQVEDENNQRFDKERVVLPFSDPMPVADFRRLAPAVEYWLEKVCAVHADNSTLNIGQVFILPAVRAEHRSLAQAWRNEGKLLDWRIFESMPVPAMQTNSVGARRNAVSGFKLKPDDVLETANGCITVRDIDRKISRVRCPFHPDPKPSEFVAVLTDGTPFLRCKRCGTIYMERARNDAIIDGLAKIAERKRLRAEREAQQ